MLKKRSSSGSYCVATYGICLATPLERQQKTDDARDERRRARSIELRELLGPGELGSVPVRDLEAEGDDNHGHAAKGEVDVEAPAPGDLVGEGAADEGAQDGGEAEEGAEEALDPGALLQGHGIEDAHNLVWVGFAGQLGSRTGMRKKSSDLGEEVTHRSREDAGGANSGNGPADDEGHRVGRRAADGRADFEEKDAGEEDDLDRVEGVDLAKEQLEGARCQQVRAAVPADVGE